MKCPHCGEEISGPVCSKCGTVTPEGASFCMECGSSLEETTEVHSEDDGEFDFENRVLCSDGTCTGIIVDGKCTECGKKHKGN